MKKIILLLFLFLAVTNCEKDDICAENTETTARLYIEFFNSANTSFSKNAFQFLAQGVDNENIIPDYNVVTTNKVYLPLKTTDNQTQFVLHIDYEINNNGTPDDTSDDFPESNPDIITINYITKQEYVSRACGYKTVFENVTITVEDDGDNWIDYTLANTDNEPISNENEAHFNLYH
ncbi:MAG: DUF6452 family protein [Oceanihabitans sp.]